MIPMNPKVLVLDIETWPMKASVWGLKDVNISLNQIQDDWSVMGWGAKWFKAPASEVMYEDVRKQRNLRDDRKILQAVWNLLDEADIVITQNGQSFDGPKLNARFILHGMPPPSPYRHLDTYRIVKRVAKFTSNKLEYLTAKLCTKYKKLSHAKFPGQSLWNECEKRNPKAWDEMRTYNIHDVLSTEELYIKLQAWAPETMPKPHDTDNNTKCGVCGAYQVVNNGLRFANKAAYRRLHCLNCGAWSKGDIIK